MCVYLLCYVKNVSGLMLKNVGKINPDLFERITERSLIRYKIVKSHLLYLWPAYLIHNYQGVAGRYRLPIHN